MTLYNQVKALLLQYPEARNSDKLLMWLVWDRQGLVSGNVLGIWSKIEREGFLKTAITPESITRARREVQARNTALRAKEGVQEKRDEKETTKGKFIFG